MAKPQKTAEEIELEIQQLRLRRERSKGLMTAGCSLMLLGLMIPFLAVIAIVIFAASQR